ncbi:MAG: hypothetical protein DRJ35_04485 [Thermoprotei archaeon]|nr:MAG: hypothetical protein DRJ35_04485 [Thermoprotei archaeon]
MNRIWIIAEREFADSIRSKRFIVVVGIFILMFMLNLSMLSFASQVSELSLEDLFLQTSISNLTFIASLLGIALGFSAISGEREKGTLLLILSRPVSRDQVLNGKTLGALAVIALSLFSSYFILIGLGMAGFNLAIDLDKVVRGALVLIFILLYSLVFYLASMFFSVISRRSSRSMVLALVFWIIMIIILPLIAFIVGTALAGPMPIGEENIEAQMEYWQKVSQIQASILSFTPDTNLQSIMRNLLGTPSPYGVEVQVSVNETTTTTPPPPEAKSIPQAIIDSALNILVLIVYVVVFYGLSYMFFVARKEEK